MSKPQDPTIVTLEFHSDGRMLAHATNPDGTPVTTAYVDTPVGQLLVVLTANPGGTGLLNAQGAHDLTIRQGAYFRVEVQRLY